jgi:hypothetical protein
MRARSGVCDASPATSRWRSPSVLLDHFVVSPAVSRTHHSMQDFSPRRRRTVRAASATPRSRLTRSHRQRIRRGPMATALEGAGVARLVNNLGLTAGSCAATHLVQYGARVAPGRLRQKAFRRRPSGERKDGFSPGSARFATLTGASAEATRSARLLTSCTLARASVAGTRVKRIAPPGGLVRSVNWRIRDAEAGLPSHPA